MNSSYITEQEARILAAKFQKDTHMNVGNDLRLYARDANGIKTKLKSWFMKIENLNELLKDSQDEIDAENKVISGIRIYPALQDKTKEGDSVPPYHTLLIVATTYDTQSKKHDNILLGKVQEYVEPCPSQCPSAATDLLH